MAAQRRQIVGAILLLVTAAVLFGGAALWARHGRPRGACPVSVGDRLSEMVFATPSGSGDVRSTRSLVGKPALLLFATPDCPACRIEVPAWQAAASGGGDALAAWLILVGPAARRTHTSPALPVYRHALLDHEGAFAGVLKGSHVPLIILVDSSGVVRECYIGITPPAVKERVVRSVVRGLLR
jgi:hypothetical protein